MKLRNKLLKAAIFIPFSVPLFVFFFGSKIDTNQINRFRDLAFGTDSPFPVAISPLRFVNGISSKGIFWIDNERILLTARGPTSESKESTPLTNDGVSLYILNTKTRKYTLHMTLEKGFRVLCYRDGHLIYSVPSRDRNSVILKGGPLGEEKFLDFNINASLQPKLIQCKNEESNFRPEHANAAIKPLQANDGYLFLGAIIKGKSLYEGQNQNVLVDLFSPDREEPIKLPIFRKEMFLTKIFYSEFSNEYVVVPSWPKNKPFSNHSTGWPRGLPQPVYLFSASGIIKTVMVPSGVWSGRPDVAPTKKGLFIVSNNAPSTYSGEAGGYLLIDGKMVKIYDHMTLASSVSPDGCKIAYAYSDVNPRTEDFVKVINLCD